MSASMVIPGPMPKKPQKQVRKRKWLRRVSKKQAERLQEYAWLRKIFLSLHPRCEFEDCRLSSCHVHHKKRRGKYLLITSTWMAVCAFHHQFIEDHKNWARDHSYILYK